MTFQNTSTHFDATRLDAPGHLAGFAQDAMSVYHHGSEIYGQGEAAGLLYVVEFGCVRLGRFTADGRRQVSGFCFAGDIFGWESSDEHRFFAEAIGDVGVRVLRRNRDQEATSKLFPYVLEALARFQQHLVVLGRTSVDERLAWFLCDLAERQGNRKRVKLPMQRSDIGDYLGVTFETVSRVLRRFKDLGLIAVPDIHTVDILNSGELAEIGGWERI